MPFAKRVFRLAGIYGILVLAPQYFLETRIGLDNPPPITHAEYFYGFVGVALAWQVVFLLIASDPVRYRPMMLPSILEKFTFGPAVVVLYMQGRVSLSVLAAGLIDMVLGVLFVLAWRRTAPASP
jgi:hypothetical protein